MKNTIILMTVSLVAFMIQSCSTNKNAMNENNRTFWVNSYKTEADAGAGKRQVLNIHRGESLNNPQWENFYANIEGFDFEAGYLQKIEVKEEKLDRNQVPADASSIKYTLVKVLDKQKDLKAILNGEWTLTRLHDQPINRMVVVPTLNVDLSKEVLSGNAGCNNYTSQIKEITPSKIDFGMVASTKKMCMNKNIEPEYLKALNSVNTYQIKGANVIFYNEKGEKVLSFMKNS